MAKEEKKYPPSFCYSFYLFSLLPTHAQTLDMLYSIFTRHSLSISLAGTSTFSPSRNFQLLLMLCTPQMSPQEAYRRGFSCNNGVNIGCQGYPQQDHLLFYTTKKRIYPSLSRASIQKKEFKVVVKVHWRKS